MKEAFFKVISFLALIFLRIPIKYIHDFVYGPLMPAGKAAGDFNSWNGEGYEFTEGK